MSKELRVRGAGAFKPVSVHPDRTGAINIFCGIIDK
jgi:hypothetical protein